MYASLIWLLSLEVIGLIAFPLAFRVFRWLPDRGWTLVKPLGLLLLAYGVWLLGHTQTIPNSRWSVLVVLAVMALLAGVTARRHWPELRRYVVEQRGSILTAEALFLVAFAAWALFRAHVPEINNTEQPMDFMFLNSVVSSPYFPATDAWLSGQSISYYYFGYLMVGVNALLTGVATPVAFNLGLVTTASLATVAAFGVVRNLVRLSGGTVIAGTVAGLSAAFLVVLASNLAGSLEVVKALGLGSEGFWEAIAVDGLTASASGSRDLVPGDFWWWWHASRVIPGAINEFPMFSFILGDMHPHLMSIPFVLLAVALSIEVYGTPRLLSVTTLKERWPLLMAAALSVGVLAALNIWDLPLGMALLGGAVLLNALRYSASREAASGRAAGDDPPWRRFANALTRNNRGMWGLFVAGGFALALGLAALALFTPFYFTVDGNAKGILPERELLSGPVHLLLVWGVGGLLAMVLLAALAKPVFSRGGGRPLVIGGSLAVGFAPLALWLQPIWAVPVYMAGVLLFALWRAAPSIPVVANLSKPARQVAGTVTTALVGAGVGWFIGNGLIHAGSEAPGAASVGERLLIVIPMSLVLSAAVYGAATLVSRTTDHPATEAASPVLGLLAVAAALVMGVELFYLSDVFGGGLHRMNTVFKLYYQAWILLGLVGGYSIWYVAAHLEPVGMPSRAGLSAWGVVVGVLLVAVAYYPVAAAYSRAESTGRSLAGEGSLAATLDGQAHLALSASGEHQAIAWVRAELPRDAVVLETPVVPCSGNAGGCSSWTNAGRISSSTGRPTLLGWEGHENQWRRSYAIIGERKTHAKEIYETQDLVRARVLLDTYDVQYVVVGPRERAAYGQDGMAKFATLGSLVFPEGPADATGFMIYSVGSPDGVGPS